MFRRERANQRPSPSGNVGELQGKHVDDLTLDHAACVWDVRQECVDVPPPALGELWESRRFGVLRHAEWRGA